MKLSSVWNLAVICALFSVLAPMALAVPAVTISPTSLSFGDQSIGVTSSPLTLTLTNTGNTPLNIFKIQVLGTNRTDFSQTNNCPVSPVTLAAGASCTINVTFTPTVAGARSATVSVPDNASNSPQTVALSGTGVSATVTISPRSLTFADQLIGTTSGQQVVTITNTSQVVMPISSLALAGANPSEYNLEQNCGSSLAAGTSCTCVVTFSPTASWARTAAIMMTDGAQGSPHVVGLAGNGVNGGVASFSPSSLTFTTQLENTSSAPQPFTLTNAGDAPLQLAGMTAGGDYSESNNCPPSIAPSGSCTINVVFKPSYSGPRTGWVTFDFTDPAGLQTFPLSGAGALPKPVAVTPKSASVTPNQTVQYVATISGVQSSSVTWSVDGVVGGNSTVGTISAGGLYTPPTTAGRHMVTAANNANTHQTATSPVVVSTYAGMLTHHSDTYRTGLNNTEAALTTGNVNKNQFGKLFSYPVDGQVYAQPLWVPNVTISAVHHNVVFVATQHDSVYAFDADNAAMFPNPLWHASFINPSNGVTPIPQSDVERGLDISPEIGITSTPVVDAANGVLYVEARTKDTRGTPNCAGPNNTGSPYFHFLHALNIHTGAEMPGSPMMICAQVQGTGYDNYSGTVYFNTTRQNNRAGLLLLNGVVYIAFASLEDISPYHGWVLGYSYNGSAFSQVSVFNYTKNGGKAGIWHGGGGIPADSSGNLYVTTGTGSFDNSTGGGISFAKLTPSGSTLTVTDYFSPFNQSYLTLEKINLDLSSSGPMLFPDQTGPIPHVAFFAGKTGTMYLINRDNMGKYSPTSDNVVQAQYTTIGAAVTPTGNWGTPAYFNGNLYLQGIKDQLKQYGFSNGLLSGGPVAVGADIIGYPSPTPVVSSNGVQNGIVWVVQSDGAAHSLAATLRAYDAANIAHEIYNSGLSGARDKAGPAVKFATPTVANGKVYVPTASELDVFGLLP